MRNQTKKEGLQIYIFFKLRIRWFQKYFTNTLSYLSKEELNINAQMKYLN